jgi:hypothetical protein
MHFIYLFSFLTGTVLCVIWKVSLALLSWHYCKSLPLHQAADKNISYIRSLLPPLLVFTHTDKYIHPNRVFATLQARPPFYCNRPFAFYNSLAIASLN